MKKLALLLLLSGCATASGPLDATIPTSWQPILVKVIAVDANTYDMSPAPAKAFAAGDPLVVKAAFHDAIEARADQLCSAGHEVVAEDQLTLLFVSTPPRSRVRCR